MEQESTTPPSRNVGLWVGLGCLGVLVLSCCLFSYWAQVYGWRFILSQGDETKIWASRTILVGALASAAKSCEDGAVGEDALPWFHADLPGAVRNRACLLDPAELQELAEPERSSTAVLRDTDRSEAATELGLDPSLCFEHATDRVAAVGCFDPNAGTGAIPYQIIDLKIQEP